MNWHVAPTFRITLFFMGGILLSYYLGIDNTFLYLFSAIGIGVAIVVLLYYRSSINYSWRFLQGMLISLLFLSLGIGMSSLQTYDILHKKELPYSLYIGKIISEKQIKKKTYKYVIELIPRKNQQIKNHKAILYLQKDSAAASLEEGDMIQLHTALPLVKGDSLSTGPDFRKIYSLKRIFYTTYVPAAQWSFITHETDFSFKKEAVLYRKKIEKTLYTHLQGQEAAVATALVVGNKEFVEKDLLAAYSKSGAMHLLCVSGLHVGIIYLFLSFLFIWRKDKRYLVIGGTILIIGCIWVYTFITGLTPSVVRAAIMFSFISIGQLTKTKVSIYNSLSASALLILLVDPYLLFNIGFQLSYLAVLGIVLFYTPLYEGLSSSNWLWNQCLKINLISIAAQLGTSLLIIGYFHQFSTYFLLTNLIAIPLTTLITYTAISFLLLSGWTMVATIIGDILSYQLWLLNKTIVWIEQLRYATINDIYLSSEWIIGGYMILLLLAYWLYKLTFIK